MSKLSDPLEREKKKAEAKQRIYLNKKLQLKQAFERIDYRYDVVWPAILDLRDEIAAGEEVPQLEIAEDNE